MGLARTGLMALAWATLAFASPMPALELSKLSSPETDLLVRKGIELAQSRELEKRLEADFSMEKTWDNEVLFGGAWSDVEDDAAEKTALSITCLECYTKGTVTAKLWEDLFHPTVRLEFNEVEAYAFLGVETSASGTFSINLFSSQSPIGLGFPGLSVGVVFYVDLIFGLSDEIDLTGGFYVKLADDAYLEADIFGGDITDSFFEGISTKSIPVTVKSGRATFKADLRLRVQCGAEASLDIIGIGSGAVVGIYANIIEFVAVVDSTPTCALETKEWWDLNVGAYAHLDVVVDYSTLGPVPTVSTTLLTAATMTQCWVGGGSPGGLPTITTSATTVSPTYGVTVSASGSSSYGESISVATSPSGTDVAVPTYTVTTPPSVTSALGYNSSIAQSSVVTSKYGLTNFSSSAGAGDDLVTSTVYSTTVYTLTSCAASVVNCPASYQSQVVVTQTVDSFTTVCPPSATITIPAKASSSAVVPTTTTTTVYVTTEKVVVLTALPTPVVETFAAPPLSSAALPQALAEVTADVTSVATHIVVVYPEAAATSATVSAGSKWGNSTIAAVSSTSYSRPSQSRSYTAASTTPLPPVTAGAADVRSDALVMALVGLVGFVSLL